MIQILRKKAPIEGQITLEQLKNWTPVRISKHDNQYHVFWKDFRNEVQKLDTFFNTDSEFISTKMDALEEILQKYPGLPTNGFIFEAVVAIAFSVVGLVYYLKVIKEMFFTDATESPNVSTSRSLKIALSVN